MLWNDRWIEMGGAGMVDPNVLRAVGYDPEEVTGFAFGLGVERVCARKYQVTDIREFYHNDVRFSLSSRACAMPTSFVGMHSHRFT